MSISSADIFWFCFMEDKHVEAISPFGSAQYVFTDGALGGQPTQWTISLNSANSISPGDGFSFGWDGGNTASYWFSIDSTGSGTGTEIALTSDMDAAAVSNAFAAVAFTPGLSAGSGLIWYTGVTYEAQTLPSTSGSWGYLSYSSSGFSDPGLVAAITFYLIYSGAPTLLYIWGSYSNGSDPSVSSNGIQVSLSGSYTAEALAAAFSAAVNSSFYTGALRSTNQGNALFLTGTTEGVVADGSVYVGAVTHTQISNGVGP